MATFATRVFPLLLGATLKPSPLLFPIATTVETVCPPDPESNTPNVQSSTMP